MKIYIKHISNTYNYGSCMMAINLIYELYKNNEFIEFYVDAASKSDLERLKIETNCKNIKKDNFGDQNNRYHSKIDKLFKKIGIDKGVSKIENVIVIGGDDISEYYGVKHLENELNSILEESHKKKVILLGQTMGPFTGNRADMARECLKNTKIYVRDNECLKYLLKHEFKNVNNGRDLAFLDLPMQHNANTILNKYNIKKDNYITIVPSGLTKCYTDDLEAYISENVKIIEEIIINEKLKNKNIVLLPHVLLPSHVDDRLIIRELMNRLDASIKNRIIAIDDAMLPSEAREILGNGLFTITGRMHAAVSTFFMRKPAISLSYSVKYKGVIGDGLDMNELVVEATDNKLWATGEISSQVLEKVDYIVSNYDSLVKKIDINVSQTSDIVNLQLKDLKEELKLL